MANIKLNNYTGQEIEESLGKVEGLSSSNIQHDSSEVAINRSNTATIKQELMAIKLDIGNLSILETPEKTDLVSAINSILYILENYDQQSNWLEKNPDSKAFIKNKPDLTKYLKDSSRDGHFYVRRNGVWSEPKFQDQDILDRLSALEQEVQRYHQANIGSSDKWGPVIEEVNFTGIQNSYPDTTKVFIPEVIIQSGRPVLTGSVNIYLYSETTKTKVADLMISGTVEDIVNPLGQYVTFQAGHTYKFIVTYRNEGGYPHTYESTPISVEDSVESVSYSSILINFSYPIITVSAAGGRISPELSYYQIKNTMWKSGKLEKETIKGRAEEIEFFVSPNMSGLDMFDTQTGEIIFGVNKGSTELTKIITVKLTMNGQSNSETAILYQTGQ